MESQFNRPELKCRAGCGYYGNPNWEGYCSLCRKKYLAYPASPVAGDDYNLADRLRTPSFSIKATSTPPASPSLLRADSSRFSRTEASSVAATQKRPSNQLEAPPLHHSSSDHASPTAVILKPVDRFTTLLRTLPRPVSVELENTVKHFLHKLHSRTFASIDELSDFVQKFYVRLEEKLNKNNVYIALPSQVREELWDEVEAHICLRLHKTVFAHLQDEEADLALHNKLRSLLKEVKPVDLDLPPSFSDIDDSETDENDDNATKHLLDDAYLALIDMTTKTTPQEILGCLSTCCTALFSALRAALPSPPSADDFLPALIYCVIRTNPPQIHSTIAYVERFALPRRTLDGEAAYYFTNLCCAARYLDSTDAAGIKKAKSKKSTAADQADAKEAAEKGCSIAAVKAERRLSDVTKTQEDLTKRINDLEASVGMLAETLDEEERDLAGKILNACEEADKAIETQLLIDFSDTPPNSPPQAIGDNNGQVLKLFVLGTMDAEAIEQLKASLVTGASTNEANSPSSSKPQDNQPLLIDFDADVPPAGATTTTESSS